MRKKLTFKCWNCHRKYSLLLELAGQPKLAVECPFCSEKGIVDLNPYRRPSVELFRGDATENESLGTALNLPEVIPTSQAEN